MDKQYTMFDDLMIKVDTKLQVHCVYKSVMQLNFAYTK